MTSEETQEAPAKEKYLKVTKPNGQVHYVPHANKKKLNEQNKLNKPEDRYKIDVVEYTEKELADAPDYDAGYVKTSAPDNALTKKMLEQSEKEKAELQAQLDEALAAMKEPLPQAKAADVIAMINQADTVEEVNEITADDTRVTVLKAKEAKIAELEAAGSGQ